uniref:Uncharacterized protein n=1 Tax=viral metagenome TaxID=1070528 RepID=A0A6C0LMN8_9ZZZZ
MSWHPLNEFNKVEELEKKVIALEKKLDKYDLVLSVILDEFKNYRDQVNKVYNAQDVLSDHIDILCEKDKEIHEKWDVLNKGINLISTMNNIPKASFPGRKQMSSI